eukprot:758432-Hanusia_phi.AAC.1
MTLSRINLPAWQNALAFGHRESLIFVASRQGGFICLSYTVTLPSLNNSTQRPGQAARPLSHAAAGGYRSTVPYGSEVRRGRAPGN